MSKERVYQLAKEFGVSSKDFVNFLQKHGYEIKNHMSVLSEEQVENIKKTFKKKPKDPSTGKEKSNKDESKPKQAKPQKDKPSQTVSKKQNQSRRRRPKKGSNDNREVSQMKTQPKEGKQAKEQTGKPQEKKAQENPERRSRRRRNRNRNRSKNQSQANKPKQEQQQQAKKPQEKPKRSRPQQKKNAPQAKPNAQPNSPSNQKQGRKQKKTYHEKKQERPIKLRDNSKKTKSKRVDYKKQREEKKLDQKKNRVYEIPEILTVGDLADTLDISATEIIKVLMQNGTMATINQKIDAETAQIVCSDLGYEVRPITTEDVMEKIYSDYDSVVTGKEVKRPPVVTVMGHVDHGKTSLLDKIRKTNVTAGEAGGITQHIGAYTVVVNNEKITFIDTPGHAAFTAMRSRGAQMTDIAVLVVAADDGVMPQTIEAINHAKVAGVPIIVAINKIDKEGANPERVKQELTEQGILVEEWGGDTIAVPISAKKGTNIDELLENILLVAEMEELQADPNRLARGSVIEAEVKKGKGATASLLIKHGTLKTGDTVLSGTTYGKVRTMIDDKGRRIRKAGPSMPVEISGLSDIPEAGSDFIVLEDEKQARQIAEQQKEIEKLEKQKTSTVRLDDLFSRISEGQMTDVNIIVKADVQGSVEAIRQSLEQLNNDEIRVNVIHGGVGAVNETDVMLASTAEAFILAFNVRSDRIAKTTAEKEDIDIRYYTVIYDMIEDVKKAMEGLLEPEFVEKDLGEVEVREVFRIPGGTMVAGSYVVSGKVARGEKARVIRDGVIIYQGSISSLRRFKDDVREVAQGFECGIGIENMNDIKVGDIIETYEMQAVQREL